MNKQQIIAILTKEKAQLEQHYSVAKLGLFGSYMKGKENPSSDIDIAFELKTGAYLGYEENIQLKKFLEGKFNKTVDLVRLKYMNPAIKVQVDQEVFYV